MGPFKYTTQQLALKKVHSFLINRGSRIHSLVVVSQHDRFGSKLMITLELICYYNQPWIF